MTEPVFCEMCGRRLRETILADERFLTCPKHWYRSFWTWLRHRDTEGLHSNFWMGPRPQQPIRFDKQTGRRIG